MTLEYNYLTSNDTFHKDVLQEDNKMKTSNLTAPFLKSNSFPDGLCQVFDSYVHSSNYALLAIAKLPNNELTSIHTLSLPPLLL